MNSSANFLVEYTRYLDIDTSILILILATHILILRSDRKCQVLGSTYYELASCPVIAFYALSLSFMLL